MFSGADGVIAEESFLGEPILEVVWPATIADQASWGILLAPLADGSVDRVVIGGSCLARIALDVQVGDTVGLLDSSAAQNILEQVSAGSAAVLHVSPAASHYDHFQWGLIRFGAGGGSGPEIVEFEIIEIDCTTRCATARVTYQFCGQSNRIGEEIDLFDSLRGMLSGPEALLIGQRGFAIRMQGSHQCSLYGYGYDQCSWHIMSMTFNDTGCF